MAYSKSHGEFAQGCIESLLGFIFKNQCNTSNINRKYRSAFPNTSRQNVSKSAYELKRGGYIIVEGDSVILTNKGKMKIIDQITKSIDIDLKYHLISFDIPESKRSARDKFRRVIKRMGFIQIQKSLWVSTKDLGEFVEMAAAEYGVSDFVAYFVSEKSNIDSHIQKLLLNN